MKSSRSRVEGSNPAFSMTESSMSRHGSKATSGLPVRLICFGGASFDGMEDVDVTVVSVVKSAVGVPSPHPATVVHAKSPMIMSGIDLTGRTPLWARPALLQAGGTPVRHVGLLAECPHLSSGMPHRRREMSSASVPGPP